MAIDNELKNITKYNEHAVAQIIIANEILSGNKEILNKVGVKEMIAMYLLIPYMTKDHLDKPSKKHNVPRLNPAEEFYKAYNEETGEYMYGVTYGALRNSLCHSFLSINERANQLLVDDRAIYNHRNEHSNLEEKDRVIPLNIHTINNGFQDLCLTLIKYQNDVNQQLKASAEGEND